MPAIPNTNNMKDIKDKIADILCVDSVDGLLWNYKPKNFKKGDKVICLYAMQNYYVNEEIISGQEYIVGWYDKGNEYVKGHLQIEGCRVFWNDDRFELVSDNKIEDVEYTDITNQKHLSS